MYNTSTPENVVDINSYLANPLPATSAAPEDAVEPSTVELVQTNKRLVTIVMGLTLMIGLVACVAYLAGRAMTIARSNGSLQARQTSPIVVDSPKVQESRIVKSEPIAAAAPIATPAPIAQPKVAPSVASAPVPSKPAAAPVALADAPSSGQWYLQVGHVEFPMLSAFRSTLEDKGFKSFASKGETADTRRVLLGPVNDQTARLELQQKLRAAGYESFQRRF